MIRSLVNRVAQHLGWRSSPRIYYVTPGVNWVLDEVGQSITKQINQQFNLSAQVVESVHGLHNQLLHFGSLWETNAYLSRAKNDSNLIVGTVFHGQKEDPAFQKALSNILSAGNRFEKLHTACKIMESRMLEWGVPRTKLVLIPIGVDLNHFTPPNQEARSSMRVSLGIPENAFCIGSFQKDGQGMEAGDEPKLIKGPDIFLDVLAELKKRHKLFVLLSGPARGFVKRGLDALAIPYKHIYFREYLQVATLYPALDAYLLTSREEGGPKGVLEALACRIPFVGTRVGLVPDVVTHEKDGLLTNPEDVIGLVSELERLIADPQLRNKLGNNGLDRIRQYDWSLIAARYYAEIYKPILDRAVS